MESRDYAYLTLYPYYFVLLLLRVRQNLIFDFMVSKNDQDILCNTEKFLYSNFSIPYFYFILYKSLKIFLEMPLIHLNQVLELRLEIQPS